MMTQNKNRTSDLYNKEMPKVIFDDSLSYLFSKLTDKQQYVIKNRIGFESAKSFSALSNDLGCTRQAAQQLYKSALKTLSHREYIRKAGLE